MQFLDGKEHQGVLTVVSFCYFYEFYKIMEDSKVLSIVDSVLYGIAVLMMKIMVSKLCTNISSIV